jgi:hypothetical protein
MSNRNIIESIVETIREQQKETLSEATFPKHKYADVIKAWADGEVIQLRTKGNEEWIDVSGARWADAPNFNKKNVEWQIKP